MAARFVARTFPDDTCTAPECWLATTIEYCTRIFPEAMREARAKLPFGEVIADVSNTSCVAEAAEMAEMPPELELVPLEGVEW